MKQPHFSRKQQQTVKATHFSRPATLGLANEIRKRPDVEEFLTMTEGRMLAEGEGALFIDALGRTGLIRFGVWGNAWWEKVLILSL